MNSDILGELDPETNHFRELFDTHQTGILDKYYKHEEFRSNIKIDKTDVSIMHINARSLLPKIDSISCQIHQLGNNFDLICVCETWLSPDTEALATLNGFNSFHVTRGTGNHGGGVSIYSKSNLKSTLIPTFKLCLPHLECIGIEFSKMTKKFLCLEIYRPPNHHHM